MKNEENELLERWIAIEDLAVKKANVYARLLFNPALAKEMEGLALRHDERKQRLEKLLYGEVKKQKQGGRVASNGEEEGK